MVLSKEEVRSILDAVSNRKHNAILKVIYGAGLRIREALNLSYKDIDACSYGYDRERAKRIAV